MKCIIRTGLMSAMLLASGIALAQTPAQELEVNHPIPNAQKVDFQAFDGNGKGKAVVAAVLGNATDDTDYFYFHGREGDVVSIDIDGAYRLDQRLDTYIALFQTSANFKKLAENDDATPIDPGSFYSLDARIDSYRLPATGTYVVGVTSFPRYFLDGGAATTVARRANGGYTLIISGVSPAVQQINIDIKPGSTGIAPINPKAKGKVPVALLSSNEFNALETDPASLTFGATGDEKSLSHCGNSGEDVNGDGRLDLVCHFENQLAGFEKGDLMGMVRGRTRSGIAFEGKGLLKVVPEKRGS